MDDRIIDWRREVSVELLRSGHDAQQIETILRKLEKIVFSQDKLE